MREREGGCCCGQALEEAGSEYMGIGDFYFYYYVSFLELTRGNVAIAPRVAAHRQNVPEINP